MAGQFTKSITSEEVVARLEQGKPLSIIDVREPDEWNSGHIPGAKHLPLGQISARHSELDPKRETIVVCRSGNRSGLACELLEAMGYDVVNLTGGMLGWKGRLEF
ncbi:rhodanese-like domain-containing protein [Cohnella sp. AR92]|uniref:rhodanese-like domain-containing protein n=1 Tax=Cohnella sp. AR92 TaxID=648716 RepID=UPI000F8F230C|nr:rhodanese-like domain-containing protein [Cohnella sp. AR92]RUS45694.1 rhodanese-like domain-containing protein [Cohnella sp. AR92]